MSNKNDIDWVWVGKLIDAAASARSHGFTVGTTNWGAHIYRAVEAALRDAPQAEPANLELAVIGVRHFGNPIPKEWYAAARELLAATPSAPTAVEPDERAEFEAWWEQFAAEHEEWRFADSHALRWQAWQARASKGTK